MSSKEKSGLPPKQHYAMKRAIRLEWITIAALLLDTVFLYITMGQSQAMKTAWVDNVLSLTPPIVFLISERIRKRPPDEQYPYGFHRIVSIAFLIASTALALMGFYLLYEAISKLVMAERPSIGTMSVFGYVTWAGWPMVAAAAWSGVSAAIIGRLKLPLGPILHNKVLHADAEMNKADWLTSAATIAGVIGIGFGWWWADAVAAGFISFQILKDGLQHVKRSISDLIDRVPKTVDKDIEEPIVARVKDYFKDADWIKDSEVRLHEEGNLFFGEAYVVPRDESGITKKVANALRDLRGMDWRLKDITITPVPEDELASQRS